MRDEIYGFSEIGLRATASGAVTLAVAANVLLEDNIRAVLGRYLYRLKGDWFIGGQFVVTNMGDAW